MVEAKKRAMPMADEPLPLYVSPVKIESFSGGEQPLLPISEVPSFQKLNLDSRVRGNDKELPAFRPAPLSSGAEDLILLIQEISGALNQRLDQMKVGKEDKRFVQFLRDQLSVKTVLSNSPFQMPERSHLTPGAV